MAPKKNKVKTSNLPKKIKKDISLRKQISNKKTNNPKNANKKIKRLKDNDSFANGTRKQPIIKAERILNEMSKSTEQKTETYSDPKPENMECWVVMSKLENDDNQEVKRYLKLIEDKRAKETSRGSNTNNNKQEEAAEQKFTRLQYDNKIFRKLRNIEKLIKRNFCLINNRI